MREPTAVLIAAASGRALAASARRGGYVPLVADFFGDQDTVATAHAHVRLPDGLAHGMRRDDVLAALERLAMAREPAGVVCGTGFEDRPELIGVIARRWRLFGNTPEIVARTKDPFAFAKFCRDCDIPHSAGSLVWRGHGAGTHVAAPGAPSARSRALASRTPWPQSRQSDVGRPALVVGGGRHSNGRRGLHRPRAHGGPLRRATSG